MATTGKFICSKITFDRISRHFRSIHDFFSKWPPVAISIGTYLIFSSMDAYKIITYTKLLHHIFSPKWLPSAIFIFRFTPKSIGFIHSVINGCVKYEFDECIVSQLHIVQALAFGDIIIPEVHILKYKYMYS